VSLWPQVISKLPHWYVSCEKTLLLDVHCYQSVAKEIGIPEDCVYAAMNPRGKQTLIEELQESGTAGPVGMIGTIANHI